MWRQYEIELDAVKAIGLLELIGKPRKVNKQYSLDFGFTWILVLLLNLSLSSQYTFNCIVL